RLGGFAVPPARSSGALAGLGDGKGGLAVDAQRVLDEGDEDLGVAEELLGLARSHGAGQAGLGGGALVGAGGEEGGPFAQGGLRLGQQHPDAAGTAAAVGLQGLLGREDSGGGAQGGQVRADIADGGRGGLGGPREARAG